MKAWYKVDNPSNPLLAAAAPLFSFGIRLQQATLICSSKALRTELLKALQPFEETAQAHPYAPHLITAARYVLCLWLDGIINQTAWSADQHWERQSLLSHFPETTWGRNRLWILLEKAEENPKTYIDLMELIYVCLRLGLTPAAVSAVDSEQRTDALYANIRSYRNTDPPPLFHTPPAIQESPTRATPTCYSGIVACLIALVFSLGLFFQVHQQLAQQTHGVMEGLSHLDDHSTTYHEAAPI